MLPENILEVESNTIANYIRQLIDSKTNHNQNLLHSIFKENCDMEQDDIYLDFDTDHLEKKNCKRSIT